MRYVEWRQEQEAAESGRECNRGREGLSSGCLHHEALSPSTTGWEARGRGWKWRACLTSHDPPSRPPCLTLS